MRYPPPAPAGSLPRHRVARNILTARLNRLVEEGILEKRPSEDGHHEYVLTAKGLDLQPVLLAMTHWGDRYRQHPEGPRLVFVDRASGVPIQPISAHAADGRRLGPQDLRAVLGPGLGSHFTARIKSG